MHWLAGSTNSSLERVPTKRSHITEDLDNLELQGNELEKTLNGLSKINRWFGNSKQTLKAVQQEFKKHDIKTIVDLGCGGGDNLIAIAKWCQAENKKVKLIGIDGNQHSLEYAKSKTNFDIEFIHADILSPNFEIPDCDLLISSHFVYHFKDDELVDFLKKAKNKVSKTIIFSELERNRLAYFLFNFSGVFFSKMIRSDGLKAIKRSFKKSELVRIVHKAGIDTFTIERTMWFRLLLTIHLRE